MKKLFLIITIVLLLAMPASADYLTCDPQQAEVVTKYRIDLNGESLSAGIETVGDGQVRLYYNIDHLGNGKYVVSAQAGNDKGEWSLPSDVLEFYIGVPTPQNIGLYCVTEEPARIPQASLSLYYFSSQEIVETNKSAANILDGKENTLWVPDWSIGHPHEVQIDLGRIYQVSGVYVLPRQDTNTWGAIKNYEVHTSVDGNDWTQATAGIFLFNKEEQLAVFDAVAAKYVSLVCLSEHSGKKQASIAEINILGY